jgi:hypothetical protein
MRTAHLAITILSVLLVAAGCGRGGRIAAENDRLRDEIRSLESQLRDTNARAEELQTQVQSLMTQLQQSTDLPVVQATPMLASLDISKRSHLADTDGDGLADHLRVYLNPRDGRDRFLQIVGRLDLQIALLQVQVEPRVLAQASLEAPAVRDAYRSGFAGTHYTFEVPIQPPLALPVEASCTIHAQFTDAPSGRVFTADRVITTTVEAID